MEKKLLEPDSGQASFEVEHPPSEPGTAGINRRVEKTSAIVPATGECGNAEYVTSRLTKRTGKAKRFLAKAHGNVCKTVC